MEKDLELIEKSILAKAFRGKLTAGMLNTPPEAKHLASNPAQAGKFKGETAMELLERVLREKHSLPPKPTTGNTRKDAAPLRLKDTPDSTLNEKNKAKPSKNTNTSTTLSDHKNNIKPLKKNKDGRLF